MTTCLEICDASVQFGSIKALDRVNFSLYEGEIHAVVGEHGAGKSTLAKLVANLIAPDAGQISFKGQSFSKMMYKDTIDAGIRMVFQKMQLNEALTVSENLFIANKKKFQSRFGCFNPKKVDDLSAGFFKDNQYDLDPRALVSDLELSERALLSIVKNLYTPPRVLILDEALEKLSAQGLERIIQVFQDLKQSGCSILFVTHRIDDLYMLADRVSIIRKGKLIISENVKDLDKISLIKMAYTQFSSLEDHQDQVLEFGNLMKYNEAILKQLPISLIVFNHLHVVRMVNESGKRFFQLESDTPLTDWTVEKLFEGNSVPLDMIDEAKNRRGILVRYNVLLSLSSRRYKANIILYPIYDENTLIGNMFIMEDVTEREALRDQLVISEKLASLGLLAAGVAHEINNPLGVISNYLESFRQNKIGRDDRDSVYDYLFEQIDYITQIIGNLVSFSEDRNRKGERISLDHEIEKIIELIRFNGRSKNIAIMVDREGDAPIIASINRTEFKQVLLNLFKNSFDALSEGGAIRIRLGRNDTLGTAEIAFEDSGPGLPYEDPTDAFLPFKTSKNTSRNYGLGLSLCFNILHRYGGNISIDSSLKRGSRFLLNIPLAGKDVQDLDT